MSVSSTPLNTRDGMSSSRMEAFSDGVIAIIITIMVLEVKAPEDASPHALLSTWPIVLAYALSFTIVAIYWVNHHHLLTRAEFVGKDTLWLNNHWLFWLSLFPVSTAYIGDTRGSPFATAVYAALSIMVALSFLLLQRNLIKRNVHIDDLATSSRRRTIKNLAAMLSMVAAIPVAYVSQPLALVLLAIPAIAYFVPE